MRLVVTADAEAQIREAVLWWVEHRRAAPNLLRTELRRAFELITTHPQAAPIAVNVELPGARRVYLPRSRYHVYYTASEEFVTVIALWHSRRGQGPQV